jgi:AcrR family transcriptional regulator
LTVRSDSSPLGQRTFIEAARRAQIVDAAIDTIAELGYGQASLARIADRIGVSKGVIGYHFAGKDDLLAEVVAEVLATARSFIEPRVAGESTGAGVLRAYIESNLAFMDEYRNHVLAIVEIARNARRAAGTRTAVVDAGVEALVPLLSKYQDAGEFRPGFDPIVMAVAIRAAIDAVPRRLADDPELDPNHYGRELADLFTRAVTAGPTASP